MCVFVINSIYTVYVCVFVINSRLIDIFKILKVYLKFITLYWVIPSFYSEISCAVDLSSLIYILLVVQLAGNSRAVEVQPAATRGLSC